MQVETAPESEQGQPAFAAAVVALELLVDQGGLETALPAIEKEQPHDVLGVRIDEAGERRVPRAQDPHRKVGRVRGRSAERARQWLQRLPQPRWESGRQVGIEPLDPAGGIEGLLRCGDPRLPDDDPGDVHEQIEIGISCASTPGRFAQRDAADRDPLEAPGRDIRAAQELRLQVGQLRHPACQGVRRQRRRTGWERRKPGERAIERHRKEERESRNDERLRCVVCVVRSRGLHDRFPLYSRLSARRATRSARPTPVLTDANPAGVDATGSRLLSARASGSVDSRRKSSMDRSAKDALECFPC